MADEPLVKVSQRAGRAYLWWILGVLGLLLVLGFIWALAADGDEPELEETTVSRILYNPVAYEGRVVTVLGEVEERLDPASFLLQERDELIPEHLLVVSSTGAPMTVDEGAHVAVTGTLRIFDPGEIEAELGYALRGKRYEGEEGRPMLLATGVSMLAEAPPVDERP